MIFYIAGRLLVAIPTLFGVATAVFAEVEPPLVEDHMGHHVACHFPGEL